MADNTKIEWCDATWQVVSGCTPTSDGCRNCYSARLAGTRLKHPPRTAGLARQAEDGRWVWAGEVRCHDDQLMVPLSWRSPRRIFVADRGDLFHPDVPDGFIDRVFAIMALCPQHTFLVLTKRPERMREYCDSRSGAIARACIDFLLDGTVDEYDHWPVKSIGDIDFPDDVTMRQWPLPNVWFGASVENQATADERIPHLLATPAAKRFVSMEPLLVPVDLTRWIAEVCPNCLRPDCVPTLRADSAEVFSRCGAFVMETPRSLIDWVIVGGESGPNALPMHPDWVRSLRDQCQAAGVPYFFKQWGEWAPYDEGHCRAAADIDPYDAEPCLKHLRIDGIVTHRQGSARDNTASLLRLSKKPAGSLLDGREWNEVPS